MAGSGTALADPGLGLNYAMVVHGEQRFSYTRPITAGDVVTAQVTITDIRDAGRNVMLTTSTEIRTMAGEHVCTAVSTIVERGAEHRAAAGPGQALRRRGHGREDRGVTEQVTYDTIESGAELPAVRLSGDPAQPGQVLRRVR